jgi:hypothetical protein
MKERRGVENMREWSENLNKVKMALKGIYKVKA